MQPVSRKRLGNTDRHVKQLPARFSENSLKTLLASVVATAFDLPVYEITSSSRRCAPVAFARQVAIYLAHVGLGLSFTDTGRVFHRDRTTVAHACKIVEERRDDACLDVCLDYLEVALRLRFSAHKKGLLAHTRHKNDRGRT
ncbi:MAG: hypothetical protein JKY32_12475 [Rhizobiales bacterium]|nr:hypothetical protein [Hyphomicrobiales bacterium]